MALKIKPEHLAAIEEEFIANKELIKAHKVFLQSPACLKKPIDLEKRLRWDVFNKLFGSVWICDIVYLYANDDHIDSALRYVMGKIKFD